jgi:SAM-dependent methyltransferase
MFDTQKSMSRRLGSRVRRAVYRIATAVDRIVYGRRDTLLPPAHLRLYYYRTWSPKGFARACDAARTELAIRGLRPDHRVLDIGSGIGNLAISLTGYLRGGYDGVEIHPEAVAWCQQAITRKHPGFRFHRADLASRAYNPGGLIPASEYRFPFPDETFDFIFLSSVFTHMLPDAVEHYLQEMSRLLAPGGVCVASYFLINDQTRAGIDQGLSFMSFSVPHGSGVCRLHDAAIPEAAVAFEETFIQSIHEQAGLQIRDIRRGRWWSGQPHDQDVLAVVPDPDRSRHPRAERRLAPDGSQG